MTTTRMPGRNRLLQPRGTNASDMRPLLSGVVALLLCFAFGAGAQSTATATLVGTVKDSTGAVVPGAKVRVVNLQTSATSEGLTSAEGGYYIPYLNSGTYRITLEAAGFKQYVRDGIVLRPGETPRVDIALDLGDLSQAVTVTASAPLLNTEDTTTGSTLQPETLLTLTNVQKRIVRLLSYMPGIVGNTSQGFHMLGQYQNAIGYSLDGIGGKWPGVGTFDQNDQVIQTTQDALEEVKVVTSGMSAEYGHAAGGAVQLTYRSGANSLHGSVEERLLRTPLVYREYFQTASTPIHFDTLDVVATGPLYIPKIYNGRNRTFFLFGLARHAEVSSWETRTEVPTTDMLNGDFSFGGAGLPIYDPSTIRQVGGTWTSDVMPGNIVPKNRFDPAVLKFLSYQPWAKPNAPGYLDVNGPHENLIANGDAPIHRTRWDIKIDHQFTSTQKVFARYSQARHRARRANYNPQLAWTQLDIGRQPQPIDLINGVLNYTAILSPTRFNEVRIGYNRRRSTGDAFTYGQNWAETLGLPGVGPETFPYFNIGWGLSSLSQQYESGEEMTVQDNFVQAIRSHTLKAGYELLRSRYNSAALVLPSGQYNFGGTSKPFTPNTGYGFASFVLGSVTSAAFSQRFANWLPRATSHALYLQDDWKVRSGLTVNLGLRWSYETPFHTKYDQQSQFDPTAADPLTGKTGALLHPTGYLSRSDWNNFQPRLGLVWNFQKKWVLRSSFGVMTQDIGGRSVNANFQDYNGSFNVAMPTGDPRPAFFLSQGPGRITYPAQTDGTIPWQGTNYSSRSASYLDPNLRNPYIMNWSAGLQYEFAKDWLLEARYEGSAGVGLLGVWNINEIPLSITLGGNTALQDIVYQAQQNYKPYTHFGTISMASNFNHTTYHGGTVRVEKRLSSGFTLNTYYTYGKALNGNDSETGGGGVTYYNQSLQKGRAGYDRRHQFRAMLDFDLPFGKGRRWLRSGGMLDAAFGGWKLAITQTFDSGRPFSVGFSNSPYKYLTGTRINTLVPVEQAVTPDWTIGPNRFPLTAPPQNPYLKFDAFAYPAAYTTGTLGRNVFEGPGLNVTSFSLNKTWTIKERLRLTARMDAANWPFKQPSFDVPNATYNRLAPNQFGSISTTLGNYSSYGQSWPSIQLGWRAEF